LKDESYQRLPSYMPRIRSLLLGIGRWCFKSTEMNGQVVVASPGWNQVGGTRSLM